MSSSRHPAAGAHDRPATRLVHAGRNSAEAHGFVNTPPFRGSTVLYPSSADFLARRNRFTYGLSGNPTMEALETLWSELEGAAGTVINCSGLAACTTPLLALLSAGDHLLVTDNIYKPTRLFCEGVLKRLGIETSYFDPMIGGEISNLFRPNTRAVFTESPGSLTFEMQDVPAIAAAARAHGAFTLMDNTWATPLLFRPLDHGVDVSIHAGTKYPAGHSDVLIGMIAANERAIKPIRDTSRMLGQYLGPDDLYLVLRGLRTMELRLREQGAKGLSIARWLSSRPEVGAVLHPALPSCPGHAFYARDFSGSAGLFSFVLAGVNQKQANAFVDALRLFGIGASWGGFESLAIPVDLAGIRTIRPPEFGGIAIRVQIGLEAAEDLLADLDQAFAAMVRAGP